MIAGESLVPVSDILDLLEIIDYNDETTLRNLILKTELDLINLSKPTKHLKALNYICIHRNRSEKFSDSANSLKSCLKLLSYLSSNDTIHQNLLSSVIDTFITCEKHEILTEIFPVILNFFNDILNDCLCLELHSNLDNEVDIASKLKSLFIVLEKLCAILPLLSTGEPDQTLFIGIKTNLEALIMKLISKLPLELSKNLLSSALPKYMTCSNSNFLETIWLHLESIENEHIDKKLFFLCLLSENYISLQLTTISYPLFEKSSFWYILQLGLCDKNDNTNRKLALYLLRKYVSIFEQSSCEFNGNIFFWNIKLKCELRKFWEKVFLLFEVLEEKQVHIVMPVLKNILDLRDLCQLNTKMCHSWIFCIFVRIFSHSANTVVRWGPPEFCMFDANLVVSDINCENILISFFESLNDMFLYNLSVNSDEIPLQDSITKWFISLSQSNIDFAFLKVLDIFVHMSWSPIPLYFITESMSKCHQKQIFNLECLNYIKKILRETLKTQCVFIRSAIQCRLLRSLTRLCNNNVDICTVVNILGCFNNVESLRRGTHVWKICVEWLKTISDTKQFLKLCTIKIFREQNSPLSDLRSCARFLILLYDCEILNIHDDNCTDFLNLIFDQFVLCKTRIYADLTTQNKCLEFLIHTLDEANISELGSDSLNILEVFRPQISNLFDFFIVSFQRDIEFETVNLYKYALKTIFSHISLVQNIEIIPLYQIAFNTINRDNKSLILEYFSVVTIEIIFENILKYGIDKDKFITPFENEIRHILSKLLFNRDSTFTYEENIDGKIISEILNALWSIYYMSIISENENACSNFNVGSNTPTEFIDFGLRAVSESGKQALVPILKSFCILFSKLYSLGLSSPCIEFITKSWTACYELRKSELFWKAMEEWMKMVFHENVIANEECHDIIGKYACEIIAEGEELVGLVDLLSLQLDKITLPIPLAFLLRDLLLFGPVLRKDRRVEFEVCKYIQKQTENGTMETFGKRQDIRHDKEVRLRSLRSLLSVPNEQHKNELIALVINDLIEYDISLTLKTKRYFNDSITHRKKHRVLQTLLILEKYIFSNSSSNQFHALPDKIFKWAYSCLQGENQQPSVRYQLEWLLIRLFLHYSHFLEEFWIYFEKAGNERIGSMCSFISISYHLAFVLNNDEFNMNCFERILPWCMSQNFNIRLYSQVVLTKLWSLSPQLSQKFEFMKENQWKVYEQGNILVNAKKMLSDFYFNNFHPIHSFNLETIFFDLPRLSNISSEEWLDVRILGKYPDILPSSKMTVDSSLYSLTKCSAPTWITKTPAANMEESDTCSLQKKFIPWKGLPEKEISEKSCKSGVILIASLIDKAANLGGLARTCEIFAAKELVIPSLEIMKDKEFIGLSMTAEKHLYITEVKPYKLADYLKMMKNLGYAIVGLEQTTGSTSLASYTFPRECIVLLGNEREGIPANLMPLLDFCIEIPQLGLVRSLNVHVSGALFLWEYSKQHTLNVVK